MKATNDILNTKCNSSLNYNTEVFEEESTEVNNKFV